MPVIVTAEDQFGNVIGEQLDRYRVRLSAGTINAAGREYEFTHF